MEPQHTCLEYYRSIHLNEKISLRVISNNKDLKQLYFHNPLVDSIIVENETDYRVENKIIKVPDLSDLLEYKTLPRFYLDSFWETVTFNQIKEPYIFIHPYSSTPYKKIEENLNLIKLIDYIIDTMNINVVLFGKSHDFDDYSHVNGYFDCTEVLDYRRNGLFNFTIHPLLEFNNPRMGWHLLNNSKLAVLSESGYLQAATYLHKQSIILLGKGKEEDYFRDIDNQYFKAFKYPENRVMDVTKFTFDMIYDRTSNIT
jgi:ADP-heptose:LPS heptosyltransferase